MGKRRREVRGSAERALRALRESEARFRSLTNLSSDWYWEQDAEFRFTRLEGRLVAGGDPLLKSRLIGQRRWDSGLQVEGGWEAHRELLAARLPFHDVLMWRPRGDGSTRYLRVSGEPVFAANGRFKGYRGVGRDITTEKRAEQLLRLEHLVVRALSQAEDATSGLQAVLRAFCESEGWSCGVYFRVDEAEGLLRFEAAWSEPDARVERFVLASRSMTFGPGDGLAGKVLQTGEPIWTSDAANDRRVLMPALAQASGFRGAIAFAAASEGRRVGVLVFSSFALRDPDPRLLQASGIIGSQLGQFLQRKRAESALRESEERFRSLTQMSSDFYWETDESHRFTQLVQGNAMDERVVGQRAWDVPSISPDAAVWAQLRATVDARRPFRDFEFGRPLPGGAVRYFVVSGEPRYEQGRFAGYRGVGRDVTELVLAREHVASLAYSDPLTGLANRASFLPAFEQAVERARRRGGRLAALFIDLDGFKQVNDAHGHAAGDRFLVEVARRLRSGVRASDLVARLGGDEFFAVLEDLPQAGLAEGVARKLLGELLRPVDLGAVQAGASGSIGIAIFPEHGDDAETLMRHADAAMYEAKQAGKNAFAFYSAGAARSAGARAD
jgi:diguanylate cyclase (GGDEF)-like protein/PAS domain S-box-containing protein